MDKTSKLILVTGATGRQGGAVARHLLAAGFNVRALTRDPDKPSGRDLQRAGAEVVKGDLSDRPSVDQAIRGAYGCFSVQNFWECGFDEEVRQGKIVADAAIAAGVSHLVYTSVGGAERDTRLPHFECKFQIEQYIRSLGISATILRPVFFMENFSSPQMRDPITQGILSLPMKPEKELQMIAADDIGAFATMAFERPDDFRGKAIELAGDSLTLPQAAAVLTRVLGRRVRFETVPIEDAIRTNKEYGEMFRWFNEAGYKADIAELRRLYPPLHTLESFLRETHYAETLVGAQGDRATS